MSDASAGIASQSSAAGVTMEPFDVFLLYVPYTSGKRQVVPEQARLDRP